MSSKEGAPEKRETIRINSGDNLYVIAIKTAMNNGASFEEATARYKREIEASPEGGVEHLEPFNKAVEAIKLELEKKKS